MNWIPTTNPEQWPPRGVEVLLAVTRWNGDRVVRTGHLALRGSEFLGNGYPMHFDPTPTHWMAIPEVPTDEGQQPANYKEQITAVYEAHQLVEKLDVILNFLYCCTLRSQREGWTDLLVAWHDKLWDKIKALPSLELGIPCGEPELLPDEIQRLANATALFADAMKSKLHYKFEQGFMGWDDVGNLAALRASLLEHVAKDKRGDQMVDVAIIAMFISHLEGQHELFR